MGTRALLCASLSISLVLTGSISRAADPLSINASSSVQTSDFELCPNPFEVPTAGDVFQVSYQTPLAFDSQVTSEGDQSPIVLQQVSRQTGPDQDSITGLSVFNEPDSVVVDASARTSRRSFTDRQAHTTLAVCQQDPTCWNPMDTLSLFGGLEGSKQPQDFGVNANFGGRWAANWGVPILAEYGIGAQIGTSINYTDNAVQVFDRVGATTTRTQNYTTLGVFQRTEYWRWGLAYDMLYESYYDQFLLGQWRGRVGYAPSSRNEYGVWFTVPEQNSNGSFLTIPVQLMPMAQGSFYWQHLFAAGTRTMFWAGVAQEHGQVNLALGDLAHTGPNFVFGAEIDVPLNQYFSIYGQANFITPADTGTVDSFLGITYYPGGGAYPVSRSAFTPFQALANNTMFATNMRRR